MKIRLAFLPLFLLLSLSLSALTIQGVVRDADGAPVAGASVALARGTNATTDDAGAFALEVPDGVYQLRVTHPGFQAWSRSVRAGDSIDVALTPSFSESIVVSGIRADDAVPVTKTDIPREEIERNYHGQDVPLLMRDAPSINAYAESGSGGAGYSYISLRGVSPTRINFTLDGVPLADSEDMGTYFVDFPDLARSLESIQIQRGVGTSTFGSASLGGSVNVESIALSQDSRTSVTLGGGSYGNRQASAGYQSGALPGGISFYTRVSFLDNDGYRDNSATKQRNLFFSGAKQLGEGQLKLTGFTGKEEQQSSYYAVDEATLATSPRFNPLRPEERDMFDYDLAQLQYIRPLGSNADMTASAYYQRGYGWFRLFNSAGDQLRQYGLDGVLVGSIVTYSHRSGALSTNYGVHVNRFKRDHTRDNVTLGGRDYANYGVKGEANAFAKMQYDAGRWLLYGDAQLRHSTFDYEGSVDIDGIDWTFFNPKIGARYTMNARSSVYASAGLATREPTRNDLFLGEDDPSVAHDLHAVRPERLLDIEAGWTYRAGNVDFEATAYAMEFHNEIAATGEQSDIGLALRRNVGRSYRRGVELDAAWQASPQLRLKTTANLSRNRIREWTQFFDVYDVDGNWTGSRPVDYRNVEPLLTPSVIVNQAVEYSPDAKLSVGATARWVGRAFLDNTNSDALDVPAYFVADANVAYAVTPWARVSLQVNNLFDLEHIYPSGYSYLYYSGEEQTGTAYYYPQAGRNAVVLLDVGF